ncbi:SMP-30/gluconolactonase/LRE family protein [Pontibacter sp. G13]|uniref:SMP-30/gluconolactonase/LRE family protein n=1 Tax=Pontibacter sp. G13 TaxID=3074898 RepID=UPI002889C893|nr:SMP-30/gluconolactonase/LRE family protein [Pontibacter sp. G13]WNJ21605.1 SMP-30/gluconolactonase/LRE family protein [Pontibacter sp. G13]
MDAHIGGKMVVWQENPVLCRPEPAFLSVPDCEPAIFAVSSGKLNNPLYFMTFNWIALIALIAGAGIAAGLTACGSPQQTAQSEPVEKTAAEAPAEIAPSVVRKSDALDALVPADAQVEILAEGFKWSEGPVWVPALDAVLFTDVPNNKIHKWSESDGLTLYLEPSGYTGPDSNYNQGGNGLLLDAEGRLVICQHGDRRVAIMDAPLDQPAPNFITLADLYDGKRFNSPNDLVFAKNGDMYFTDPPYGLPKQDENPSKEIDFSGVFRRDTEGKVHLVTPKLTRPNGIVLSLDESILYVNNSDRENPVTMAYDLDESGAITGGKVFFDYSEWSGQPDYKGAPDGIRVHPTGNIFSTGPGGVWVFSAAGEPLGLIRTERRGIANLCFGNDGQYLYITAADALMRVPLVAGS